MGIINMFAYKYLPENLGFSSYIVYAPHYLSKIQKVLEHSWPKFQR